jgi:DNA-binding NtrC family response regulator
MAYRWPGNIRELRNVVERLVLRASGRLVNPGDLPSDVLPQAQPQSQPPRADGAPARPSVVDELASRLMEQGESFWTAVYAPFDAHDLTRDDLRRLVQIGLERTNGNYRLLVQLFNMPDRDYKRFLGFLRKHDCHLPFQRFRTVTPRVPLDSRARGAAGDG